MVTYLKYNNHLPSWSCYSSGAREAKSLPFRHPLAFVSKAEIWIENQNASCLSCMDWQTKAMGVLNLFLPYPELQCGFPFTKPLGAKLPGLVLVK